MQQQAWSDKRERQYEYLKESTRERGSSAERAEEFAARSVNRGRTRTGESRLASKASTADVSPEHRGGKRPGNNESPQSRTKQQLHDDAKRGGISGWSSITEEQLRRGLSDR